MPMVRVGFVGLGDIGGPMAARIIEAGFPTTLWARRPESLEQFSGLEFARAESLDELGQTSDVVGVCVFNESDVRDVLLGNSGLLHSMGDGVVMIHSTVSVKLCAELEQRALQVGVTLIDAPISGARERAIDGELTVMVGGDSSGFSVAEPVIGAFASSIHLLGPIGSGQMMKLINNMLVFANLATAFEAISTAIALGLDGEEVKETLRSATGSSAALERLVTQQLVQPWRALHTLRALDKDAALFTTLRERSGAKPGVLEELAERARSDLEEIGRTAPARK
jgi:3-hydroxyisobutyrate dehydrogenase